MRSECISKGTDFSRGDSVSLEARWVSFTPTASPSWHPLHSALNANFIQVMAPVSTFQIYLYCSKWDSHQHHWDERRVSWKVGGIKNIRYKTCYWGATFLYTFIPHTCTLVHWMYNIVHLWYTVVPLWAVHILRLKPCGKCEACGFLHQFHLQFGS